LLYFIWHSLHARVEGNWLGPVYPAFAIVAAVAAEGLDWRGRVAGLVDFSRRSAVGTGVVMFVALALQATFGLFPLRRDPTARMLAVGWRELASDIEALRARLGANSIITMNYGLASWLAFYLPPQTPVVQINERIRWVNMPEPDRALFAGRVLYLGDENIDPTGMLQARYGRVEPVGRLSRERRGVPIATYRVDLLEGLTGDPLDRSLPVELRPR
jgi:hypothetical protein